MCSVTNGDGKRHKIFIPKGWGFIKGWDLLITKLRELGIKEKTNEERVGDRTRVDDAQEVRANEGGNRGLPSRKRSFVEIMKLERS